jgi:3-deoxy-D-manno-octulosonate 8-phosphate phosphatase (KDO 8-P phosphatase)
MIEPRIAKRVKLVGFDVDGVMTDGGVYIGSAGDREVELKRFDILDNVGVRLLRAAGIKVAIVSGRVSPATTLRGRELEAEAVVQDDMARKLEPFQEILDQHGIAWEEAAFVGDDLPDVAVLRRVGLPVVVANATDEVRALATHVTEASGGHGAVREFCESLLKARGEWQGLVRQYLHEREPAAAGGECGA